MLAHGCGCPAAPSSSSSSTATVLSTLARELIRLGILSGQISAGVLTQILCEELALSKLFFLSTGRKGQTKN